MKTKYPITLKFAFPHPITEGLTFPWVMWAEEVEKETNGKVKFEFYPGDTLFGISQAPYSVKARVADIALMSASENTHLFPVYGITQYPGLAFGETLEALVALSEARHKIIEKFPVVAAEWKDWKVLSCHSSPTMVIASMAPIRVPADIKGKKMGCIGKMADLSKSLGGAPVIMPPPEVYMGLKTGVIDSAFVSRMSRVVHKIYEVAKYFNDYTIGGQPGMEMVMNWDSWNSLPPDVQKVMTRLAPKEEYDCAAGTSDAISWMKKELKEAGGTIITPTKEEMALWDKAIEPLWSAWVDRMKAQGVDNAEEILNYWQELRAPYSKSAFPQQVAGVGLG